MSRVPFAASSSRTAFASRRRRERADHDPLPHALLARGRPRRRSPRARRAPSSRFRSRSADARSLYDVKWIEKTCGWPARSFVTTSPSRLWRTGALPAAVLAGAIETGTGAGGDPGLAGARPRSGRRDCRAHCRRDGPGGCGRRWRRRRPDRHFGRDRGSPGRAGTPGGSTACPPSRAKARSPGSPRLRRPEPSVRSGAGGAGGLVRDAATGGEAASRSTQSPTRR